MYVQGQKKTNMLQPQAFLEEDDGLISLKLFTKRHLERLGIPSNEKFGSQSYVQSEVQAWGKEGNQPKADPGWDNHGQPGNQVDMKY